MRLYSGALASATNACVTIRSLSVSHSLSVLLSLYRSVCVCEVSIMSSGTVAILQFRVLLFGFVTFRAYDGNTAGQGTA